MTPSSISKCRREREHFSDIGRFLWVSLNTQNMCRCDANGEVIPEFDIGGYFKATRRIPEAFHDFDEIDNGALSGYAGDTARYLEELYRTIEEEER